MKAQPGRTYAQVLQGRLHLLFTADDLPEWSDVTEPAETHTVFTIQAVDVTDLNPQPEPGWLWNGTAFVAPTAPAPVIPQVVSRFQAKAALLAAGLLDDVEAAMAQASPVAQLAWSEAIEFRRDSTTVAAMASQLSLTDENLDDLFVAAAQITA